MSVIIRPYRYGDALSLRRQPAQRSEIILADQVDEALRACAGWSAELSEGKIVIACGGLVAHWPGYAQAIMLADGLRGMEQTRLVAQACRRLIERADYRRIDCTVRADFKAGQRFATWSGFERVALLRDYGPDGEDHYLYEALRTPAAEAIAA